MDNVTKKIINNFRKGLITESDMLKQLYEADKDEYCKYLDAKFQKECEKYIKEEDFIFLLLLQNTGIKYNKRYGYNPFVKIRDKWN